MITYLAMLLMMVSLCQGESAVFPIILSVEGASQPTTASIVLNNITLHEGILGSNPHRQSQELVWFERFLAQAAGPQPELAERQVTTEAESGYQNGGKLLVHLYRRLILNQPKRRVMFSHKRSNETVFFWMTTLTDGTSPKITCSRVRSVGSSLKVLYYESSDETMELVLNSLRWTLQEGPLSEGIKITSTAPQDIIGIEVNPEVRLLLPARSLVRFNKELTCETPTESDPSNFAGCWIKEFFNGPRALNWMTSEGRFRAERWLDSLEELSKKTLANLYQRTAFKAISLNLGPVTLVFPEKASLVLGNKRYVLVRNGSPLSIVNFFSSDSNAIVFKTAFEKLQIAENNSQKQ